MVGCLYTYVSIFDLTLIYICYCRHSIEDEKQSSYLWFPLFLLLVQVKCTVQIPLPENAFLIPVMWYEWSSVDLVLPGIRAESVRCDWRIILAFLCFLDWGVVFMVNLRLGFKTSNFKFNLNLDLEQVGERLMAKLWRKWRSDKTVPGSESTHYEANLCNVQSARFRFNESPWRASMLYNMTEWQTRSWGWINTLWGKFLQRAICVFCKVQI